MGGMKRRDQSWEGRSDLETMQSPTKKQWINTKHKMSGHGLSTSISLLFSTSSGCCSVLSSWKEKQCGNNSPKGTRLKNLAAMFSRDYGGFCIQMRLQYSPFALFFLHWIEWMDFSCTDPLPSFLGLFHILLYKVLPSTLAAYSQPEI
ncbi:hypothetical protein SDJN02_06380 [Cucurbita argyrosperma subsp. argyrosperma]|nr:hypothetical protein SDJN02_06380 [Cucurbita argyrosperma subsp. argyrosperma]